MYQQKRDLCKNIGMITIAVFLVFVSSLSLIAVSDDDNAFSGIDIQSFQNRARHSSPEYEGKSTVTIHRDSFGVAHIDAPNMKSLFTAWGYTTAQDRLFTLETLRAVTQGRVAEMFGPGDNDAFIEFDKLQRTLNVPGDVELKNQLNKMPKEYRHLMKYYADGINIWIKKVMAQPDKLLHYAFIQNGISSIKPWDEMDVAHAFHFVFNGGWANSITTEILNLSIYDHLTSKFGEVNAKKMIDDVLPMNVPDHIPTLPGTTSLINRKNNSAAQVKKQTVTVTEGLSEAAKKAYKLEKTRVSVFNKFGFPYKEGSYIFMFGGKMTEGNDTYFFGGPQSDFFYPGRFYETGLHCPEMNVVGQSTFGVPALFNGSNENVAFGLTSNFSNISDVFVLTLDKDDYHYIYKGKRKKMKKNNTVIKVKGQKDIHYRTYTSVYGPVYVWGDGVAFSQKQSWEGVGLETFVGMIEQMQSKNGDQFRNASKKIRSAWNYGYADNQGNFGYVYCGRIPIVNPEVDLRFPTPGTGEYDWLGYYPASWNPNGANLEQGFIVNWNNIPTVDFRYNDGYLGYWNSFNRVYRIYKALKGVDKIDFEGAKGLIKDIATVNFHCDYLLPYFEQGLKNETDQRLLNALKVVQDWDKFNVDNDFDGKYDGAGYTIWEAWIKEVFARAFGDEMGPWLLMENAFFVYAPYLPNMVIHHLEGDNSAVPVQYSGWLNGVSMETVIRDSLASVVERLEVQYAGIDINEWKTPVTPHKFASGFYPGIPGSPIGVRDLHVYMYRGTCDSIIRFSNGQVAQSVNISPPGVSGFVDPNGVPSPHFYDQLDLFEDFNGYKPLHVYLDDAISDRESIEVLNINRGKK